MTKNWEHAAGIVWGLLVQAAQRGKTITYGEVAPTIATNPLSVGHALGPIQNYCLENRLPPLTAIVVGATTGVPGGGFIAWEADDLSTAHGMVFAFDWTTIANPYGGFGETDTVESLAEGIARSPGRAADVYAKVKVRGVVQRIFRQTLLETYQGRCAMCGLTFEECLDAAHLKSWQKCLPAERLDPANGVLLCATHHRLFDAGLITLGESLRVVYFDPAMKHGEFSEIDKKTVAALHGRPAFLPSKRRHWPSLDFLRAHHREKKWGSVR